MGLHPYVFTGTILAGGTLSNEFDLGGMESIALKTTSTPSNGTLSFQVSTVADDGINVTYRDLYSGGSVLSFTAPGAGFGLGSVELAPLLAYRFVKVKSSVAQANGLGLHFIAKG